MAVVEATVSAEEVGSAEAVTATAVQVVTEVTAGRTAGVEAEEAAGAERAGARRVAGEEACVAVTVATTAVGGGGREGREERPAARGRTSKICTCSEGSCWRGC